MKDERIHTIIDWLCRFWAGTPDSGKDEVLPEETWKRLKDDLESDRYVMGRFKEYSKYDAAADFRVFLDRVGEPMPVGRNTKRRWVRLFCAASVVLFILGAFFFYGREYKNPEVLADPNQLSSQLMHLKMASLILEDQGIVALDQVEKSGKLDTMGVIFNTGPQVIDYTRVKKNKIQEEADQYHTLVVPKGCLYKLILSDGTRVTLNADSKIKYPVVFPSGKREVYLQGEAFFEVAKDSGVPFLVVSGGFAVRVLGTRFNVMNYDNESVSNVTLLSGSVEMRMRDTIVQMVPGEQVVMEEKRFVNVQKVNPRPYVSWMEDKFCFENERLEVILRKLSRWYDVDILYDSPRVKEARFTGYIPNDIPVGEVLKLLEETTDIGFTLRDSVVSVKDLRHQEK